MARTAIKEGMITLRSLVIGAVLAATFAIVTVYLENRHGLIITATQIAVLPYVLLILVVMAINPLLRLIRFIRPLTTTEVLLIFIMGAVSAGIPTFGLASQLVPAMSGVFNEHWNNEQTEWNRYVVPYISDRFLVGEPGVRDAAIAYKDALDAREAARRDGSVDDAAMAEFDAAVESAREELQVLEAKSFEMVREFRRRMPDKKRAYPGFLPLTGESWSIYRARLRRLVRGREALADLKQVHDWLSTGDLARVPEMQSRLDEALAELESISSKQHLIERKAVLDAEWKTANEEALELTSTINALKSEQRLAPLDRADELETEIAELTARRQVLEGRKQEVQLGLDQVRIQMELTERVLTVMQQLAAMRDRLDTPAEVDSAILAGELGGIMREFRWFDASLERFLVGDIPWSLWLRPLMYWSVLILFTYVMLMTFNVLIFRQWAYNERLIFPLAQLPEILAGNSTLDTDSGEPGRFHMPAVFRSSLFYVGMGIALLFVGWNFLAHTGWVPGLSPIALTIEWKEYIGGTIFEPVGPKAKLGIFFTMIGLAFLIPSDISFSLWFFWLLYMGQLLIIVWLGHGVNENSFPTDWWYTLNFRTSEAGGALMIFSGVVLYKCRRYLFCLFDRQGVAGLEAGEQKELRISSGLFLGSSLGLVLMLWLGLGANLFYSIVLYLFVLMLTIGLVRAVAEGGLLGFQAWISPFHFVRSIFGFNHTATAPSLFTPLTVFYSILFLDIKTFIAPAMANSLKIRDDLKMPRLRFHIAIIIGIGLTLVISIIVHIMLGYAKGADAMNGWFYSSFPQSMYQQVANMAKSEPVDQTANRLWIGVGAASMGGLLYLRQFIFWLPHPIGLIMLVNPMMGYYWFSIFLGWLAKSMTTRYGNKGTYNQVRNIFIGMIVAELLLVALAALFSVWLEIRVPIDLNRNY